MSINLGEWGESDYFYSSFRHLSPFLRQMQFNVDCECVFSTTNPFPLSLSLFSFSLFSFFLSLFLFLSKTHPLSLSLALSLWKKTWRGQTSAEEEEGNVQARGRNFILSFVSSSKFERKEIEKKRKENSINHELIFKKTTAAGFNFQSSIGLLFFDSVTERETFDFFFKNNFASLIHLLIRSLDRCGTQSTIWSGFHFPF